MYDAIIIGAGMSGLAAGIRSALFDKRVCIVERHSTIGGLNSFYRLRGRNYDVGLHALTNFTPKGARTGPLARLLRQLRFRWDDFALCPQRESRVAFPSAVLRFSNDPALLESQIGDRFPREVDNFRRLVNQLCEYDNLHAQAYRTSARSVLRATMRDELLPEMLLCPLMWYGNASEHDMDLAQFSIMFRSVFLEGFARPHAGVRAILKQLVRRFRELAGELRLRAPVKQIMVEDRRAVGVVLESGEELPGRCVLSSAGIVETLRLCEGHSAEIPPPGRLSFAEAITVLDVEPASLGCDATILFFNDSPRFCWANPEEELVDVRTGVLCSPNNYDYGDEGALRDNVLRLTSLANFDRWKALSAAQYTMAKLRTFDQMAESAVRFIPDFRHHVIDADLFTPKTIQRFTAHEKGAVYGCPQKRLDGRTGVEQLFVCGADQGFVGIVGAIFSGISMANRHVLP